MSLALRFTVYTLSVLILSASLPAVVEHMGVAFFHENGAIEWLQFGLIVSVGAVLLGGALAVPPFRRLFLLLACFPLLAGCRELDALLDEWVPWIGWKIGFLLVLYPLVRSFARRRELKPQLALFSATAAFAILWAGLVVALPIAQLVGHGPFLQLAMGDGYVYVYKQMIEEILELMGYLLLLAGGIEAVAELRSARPAAAATAAIGGPGAALPAPVGAPPPSTPAAPVISFFAAADRRRSARKSTMAPPSDRRRP